MRVSNFDTANSSADDFQRYTSKQMQDVIRVLNKGILFSDNFDGSISDVTFSAPNSDVLIMHNLNREATGFIVLSISAAMIVYQGSELASKTQINLKSNAVGTARVLIF